MGQKEGKHFWLYDNGTNNNWPFKRPKTFGAKTIGQKTIGQMTISLKEA